MKFEEAPIRNYTSLLQPGTVHSWIFAEIYNRGGVICGGFPRSCATINAYDSLDFKDFDIYPENEKSYIELFECFRSLPFANSEKNKNIVFGNIKESSAEYSTFETTTWEVMVPGASPHYRSGREYFASQKFQLVRNYIDKYLDIEEFLLKDFDLSICQAYFDFFRQRILVGPKFLEDDAMKRIRFMNYRIDENVEKSVERIMGRINKYVHKGYRISMTEFHDILNFLPDDYNKIHVLKWLASILGSTYEKERMEGILKIADINVSLAQS